MNDTYRVEYFDRYDMDWTAAGDGYLNEWPTIEAAEDAINDLKECGDDWATAEYRIVENA